MPHSFTNILVHAVFGTQDRCRFIDEELRARLLPYLAGIARELDASILTGNAMPDHVHLLVRLPPNANLADVMRVAKTNSSRWVHQTWASRPMFAWQTGYGAFSVSQSNRAAVSQYIGNQEKHHRRFTFQQEFMMLLRKNGVDFDERYIGEILSPASRAGRRYAAPIPTAGAVGFLLSPASRASPRKQLPPFGGYEPRREAAADGASQLPAYS